MILTFQGLTFAGGGCYKDITMVEQSGEVPIAPEQSPQTPTEASKGFLHKMNEAGSAKLAALLGWTSGVNTVASAFALSADNKTGAIAAGLLAVSTGILAMSRASEADNSNTP